MEILFYRLLLPLLAACNLALGLLTLGKLGRLGWLGAVELATGAICCAIGGGVVGAVLIRSYSARTMRRQIATWRLMTDAFVQWIDESRTTDESLDKLRRSIDEIVSEERARAS